MTKEEASNLIQLSDSVASAKEQIGFSGMSGNPVLLDRWVKEAKARRDIFVKAVQAQIKEWK